MTYACNQIVLRTNKGRCTSSTQRIAVIKGASAVALDNGYTSQSAFAAMFKKHFGTTPTDFYRTAPTVVKKNAAMHQ